jgi:hypothetical protein
MAVSLMISTSAAANMAGELTVYLSGSGGSAQDAQLVERRMVQGERVKMQRMQGERVKRRRVHGVKG